MPPDVFFYEPHPDDGLLSAGLALLYYIGWGFPVHIVSMCQGAASAAAINGTAPCPLPEHPYTHSPDREGYLSLTDDDVAAIRIKEARSTLGAMAMFPPNPGVTPGPIYHHVENLATNWGCGGCGSSTALTSQAAIDATKAVMLPYIQGWPNSFHYTMSPADHHTDHRACGMALSQIKAENPTLFGNPRFFVSRLYWATTQPDGHFGYAQDLLDAAHGTLGWFPYGPRYSEMVAFIRDRVLHPYRYSWNPAGGAFSFAGHQVLPQFDLNFGVGQSVANLWHG